MPVSGSICPRDPAQPDQYAEPFFRLPGQSSVRRARAVPHWFPAGMPKIADTKWFKELTADDGRSGVNISSTVLAEMIGFGGFFPDLI